MEDISSESESSLKLGTLRGIQFWADTIWVSVNELLTIADDVKEETNDWDKFITNVTCLWIIGFSFFLTF